MSQMLPLIALCVLLVTAGQLCFRTGARPAGAPIRPDVLRGLGLTARESEIAALAAEGYSVLNVAARLNISPWTVRTHLREVYRKLDVGSRAALSFRLLTAGRK